MENANEQKLLLENQRRLTSSGVENVDGFSEQHLCLTLTGGGKLRVSGEKIRITAFNKATGNIVADGLFTEFKYNYKKQPLFKRLFK